MSLWLLTSLHVINIFRRSQVVPCEAVYFWGGGKAGSTTLAALLKHDYDNIGHDPMGQFIDSPKEICWAERTAVASGARNDGLSLWRKITKNKCYGGPEGKKFVLDACPRYTTVEQAETIVRDNPRAKFIMLVRDPIDRLVSHVNDKRRESLVDVESVVRHLLSRYGQNEGDDDRGVARRRRLKPDKAGMSPGSASAEGGDAESYADVDDNMLMANAKQRRLNEYGYGIKDMTRIDRTKLNDMKRDLLRERLGKRKTLTDRMAERAELIRNRGGGATVRRAILGQRGEGVVPSKFSQLARLPKNYWQLSLYGENLQSLLSVVPSSQVLIVQTDTLARDPQHVVNDIMQFIGGKPKRVQVLHENKLKDLDSYRTISSELRHELEDAFEADVQLLETLVGRRFQWSWIQGGTRNPDVKAVDDWLSTVPTSRHVENSAEFVTTTSWGLATR